MQTQNSAKKFKVLQGWRVFIPIIIGIGSVMYLFWDEFNYEDFKQIPLAEYAWFWFILAACMMLTRDAGYVLRLKLLSGNSLSWKQCIRIIFLWEFTSAVTPSAVGGTTFAVIYIYKERVNLGKSSAIVLATSFLDELYFLIMFPLIILSVNFSELFEIANIDAGSSSFSESFVYFAVIGYSIKAAFTFLVVYGLFINPYGLKKMLFKLFSIKFLKRWRRKVVVVGSDIMLASKEFKGKSFWFWIKAFFATFISWTSRYWVINFLFLAYFVVHDHFLIFARQLIMWIMLLIFPSPGGSGFAEVIFKDYLGEFIPYVSLIAALAMLWRIITYYPYLLVGVFLLPSWLKKKF